LGEKTGGENKRKKKTNESDGCRCRLAENLGFVTQLQKIQRPRGGVCRPVKKM